MRSRLMNHAFVLRHNKILRIPTRCCGRGAQTVLSMYVYVGCMYSNVRIFSTSTLLPPIKTTNTVKNVGLRQGIGVFTSNVFWSHLRPFYWPVWNFSCAGIDNTLRYVVCSVKGFRRLNMQRKKHLRDKYSYATPNVNVGNAFAKNYVEEFIVDG